MNPGGAGSEKAVSQLPRQISERERDPFESVRSESLSTVVDLPLYGETARPQRRYPGSSGRRLRRKKIGSDTR